MGGRRDEVVNFLQPLGSPVAIPIRMNVLNRLFHRCKGFEFLEELHHFDGLNPNFQVAHAQVSQRVRERNALWRVRCPECGRVRLKRYLTVVPEN